MPRSQPVIRLVGGPHKLDGTTYDIARSPHDRADVDGHRFVRAVRGSSVMSLAALQERCTDRPTTERLAETWGCAVFSSGRDRRHRTRYFRYEATYRLQPTRDGHGRWSLVISDTTSGPAGTSAVVGSDGRDGNADPGRSTWTVLESAVDDAATRFGVVASLLPDGPLADRAESTRSAVGSCVTDAARLCSVGTAIAPDWPPAGCDDDERSRRLATRIATLVGTIDEATAHLVDLHLEIGDGGDPIEPVAHLRSAWVELSTG